MARKKRKTGVAALREALVLVSPGTQLREAISAILQSGNGALVCIGDPKRLSDLSEAGVEINAEYTPQLLYELAKMDGAIILNEDASRIAYANRFLKPDTSISTDETGTRHRAAERIARQAGCIVVAVSERRSSVTLYVHDTKHVLDSIPTLLNKAMQAINTLEKYIRVLDQATTDLSTREFEDVVTIFDVCKAIQRCEMVVRIAKEIEPFILELGTEGRLIAMQLKELVIPIEEAELVAKDYYREKAGLTFEQVQQKIDEVTQQELLNLGNISQALGYGANLKSIDTYLSPRGYRILTQTHRLTPQIIENLVLRFGSLQAIMRAPKEELCEVDGIGEVLAERVRLSLNSLRNQLALDRGRR
ncbi:MAG: DNA integrity scanning protein DisA [Candidatus Hydrogenedentes bacterium]|nr:DNA integrity scanning protein DisA [Candidatus Hydrogenedentota bacterium]